MATAVGHARCPICYDAEIDPGNEWHYQTKLCKIEKTRQKKNFEAFFVSLEFVFLCSYTS